ncbi:uncharacterized protein NPIL_293511 [Nephila pilipes]|uniref:Uncharacterized protein n=1 Tax=Nephila pilipes TaxID=299642 RepID=A0A8X6NYL5_NEPPI|nr:uncharacterized protein NPIL_293511 [Nephila pilipes]
MMIPEPDISSDSLFIKSQSKGEKIETYFICFSVLITLYLLIISVLFKFMKPGYGFLAPLLIYTGFGILILSILCLLCISYYNRNVDDEKHLISSKDIKIEIGQII